MCGQRSSGRSLLRRPCCARSRAVRRSRRSVSRVGGAGRVFSLARGLPAVEDHIRRVSPVVDAAARMTAAEFQVALFTALGVPRVESPTTPAELLAAERMRLQRAPWEAVLDPWVVKSLPTLVITGNWNPEYEEIAERLVTLGAAHMHLEGYGHAVQESPDFNPAVEAFWAKLESDARDAPG